jgi:cell wall-associated NlpC family hydrolase
MNSTSKLVVTIAMVLSGFVGMATIAPNADAATLRNAAMASAKTQLGARYHSGAAGGYSNGYDCSGLTYWSYKKHGKTLPRTAQSQYSHSHHVSPSKRQPGDLIFIVSRGRVTHVGIFTGVKHGKGYMINANSGSYRGRKVVEAPVSEYTAGSPYAVYGRY